MNVNTKEKEKQLTKSSLDKAVFVKAMTEMIMNLSPEQIKIPVKYREQVLVVKELLKNDTSGMINSLLDFAITSALVDYTIETNNPDLTKMFNDWLDNVNGDLIGKIPTGLNALAKEYFRERWKGSSFIVLRSIWEERNGFILPTKLWFVDGEDVVITNDKEYVSIGGEKYALRLSPKQIVNLPASTSERIFIQKPFESWGAEYPIPFIIRRGLFKNLRLMDILATKGEFIVGKALEYLLLIKKGSEQLALANNSDFTYSADDLKGIKTQLEDVLSQRKTLPGVPTYATNFDTDIQHLIPEYDKALKQELFTPIERRIMAGMGLIDVLQGVASTRKETQMNPRPFIAEVEAGVKDFKALLNDILVTIIQVNKVKHPKHIGQINKIHSTPISQFMTDSLRDAMKDLYDRGTISKRTYVEVVGEVDFDIEVQRKKSEDTEEIKKLTTPPIPPDKIVPPQATLDTTVASVEETSDLLEAIYKTVDDLPENIKNSLPASAQKIWMKIFNDSFGKGEDYARKVAWTVIKKLYKKVNDKWVLKKKIKSDSGSLNLSDDMFETEEGQDELLKLQIEIAKKILGEYKNENIQG